MCAYFSSIFSLSVGNTSFVFTFTFQIEIFWFKHFGLQTLNFKGIFKLSFILPKHQMGLNSITNYSNSISKTKRVNQRKKIGNLLNSNKMAKHPNLNRLPIQLDYKIYSNLEIDDLFNLSLVYFINFVRSRSWKDYYITWSKVKNWRTYLWRIS